MIFGRATDNNYSRIFGGGVKMRFCDKLPKLRKENNLSQEQLADRLGVSRQAVSKWESGTSYPDMDKIMTLCKILNCSLDDLIDDAAMGNEKKKEERVNVNTYLKEVLDFITKTTNMFWSMRLVEKIKCLLEMGFILMVLIVFGLVINEVLHVLLYQVISLLPEFVYIPVEKLATLIYGIFALTMGAIIFIHIFKIRYLDYFVTIEDKQTTKKSIEKPVEEQSNKENEEERVFLEKKKNKIIIRDPVHSTYNFFYILAKFVIFVLKIMAVIILFAFVLTITTIAIMDIFSILHINNGVFFIGTTIALIATTIVNYLIIELLYNFIFNQKNHFKRTFIIFIISIIVLGTGIGISINEYLSFKPINIDEDYKTVTKKIEYKENLVLPLLGHSNVQLIEDETLSNIKIEFIIPKGTDITTDEDYIINNDINTETQLIYYHWFLVDDYTNGIDEINKIIDKLEKKERIDIINYQVKIYTNKKIMQNILNSDY